MMDDEQLLGAYARERSEAAFGELVARHIDFVYSTALRMVNGDGHLAQDVAQTVFIELAREAGSLPDDVALPGWLHRHTCYTATKAVRTERRRQSREQAAMEMRALDDNTRPEWEQVAPYLDESLNQLNPADRDALVLRFLKQQDLRTVGAALGISDDAAQKRVDRALEKLHVLLKRRGATISATALGIALATATVTAAPMGLAGSVAATALASAAAGGATTLAAFKSMTLAKLTLGAAGVVVAGALVAFLSRGHPHNPSGGLDQYIEITTGIDVTWFYPDPTNAGRMVENTHHYTAVCTMGRSRWRIDHDFLKNGEASLMFDTTNVYQLTRETKPMDTAMAAKLEELELDKKLGLDIEMFPEAYSNRFIDIWPGDLPLNDVGANLPWLAFCSGHYLKKKGRVLPLLFNNIRYTPGAFACRDETSCSDDELGLPRSVDWKYSAAALAKSLDNPLLSRSDYMMKRYSLSGKGIKDGALRSRYTVLEWTNYSGRHIPTKFEHLQCAPHVEWSSNPWFKAVGQVANIRHAPEPKSVFLLDTNQWVTDYRFRSSAKLIDFIHYRWPSNAIPSTSDPSLVALYKRKEALVPADPRPVVHWWQILPGFGN